MVTVERRVSVIHGGTIPRLSRESFERTLEESQSWRSTDARVPDDQAAALVEAIRKQAGI